MPSSSQPSAGVSAFAFDTAPAVVSKHSKAAGARSAPRRRRAVAFEGLGTAAGAVPNAEADTPAEGCALDGIWISEATFPSEYTKHQYVFHIFGLRVPPKASGA